MQMSLAINRRFFFRRLRFEMTRHVDQVFLIFVCLHTRSNQIKNKSSKTELSRYPEEYSAVDIVGIEKLLNPVSCKINRLLDCDREHSLIRFLYHSRSRAQFYFSARRAWLRGKKGDHSRSNRLLFSYRLSKKARLTATKSVLLLLVFLVSQFRPRGVFNGLFRSFAYICTRGQDDI